MKKAFSFSSKILTFPSMGAWHFAGVPKDQSLQIKAMVKIKAGFGSIPVTVQIGNTIWSTSIFPDKKSGCYVLPIKASVRKKEEIIFDDLVKVNIKLLV